MRLPFGQLILGIFLALFLVSWWGLFQRAYARGEEAIQMTTPEALAIKKSMKTRFAPIAQWKNRGVIGEGKWGFLVERDIGELNLEQREQVKQIVQAANADRMKLYKEIIRANSYPERKLKEVQIIFAKSWRRHAQPGWWVQQEDGAWKKKS